MTGVRDHGATAGPGRRLQGSDAPRREDARLLTGRGAFVADLRLAGTVEVAFVRSPVAHARIGSVRTEEAARAPGVLRVISAADLHDVSPFPDLLPRLRPVRQRPLAGDRVRYVGAPVVAVVATDRYLAEDAAELVELDLEELPVVADMDAALDAAAPRLYDDWPDNIVAGMAPVNPAIEELFARSRVVRVETSMQRHTAMPLETRGVVAHHDRGRLTVWTSTQVAHQERTILARMLGLPEHRIRVIAGDVGGGFGGKLHLYPEDVVVAWLATRLGRPVRWIEDRREHFLASSHAREQRQEMEAALAEDGTIAAVRVRLTTDVGSGELLPPGTAPSFVSAASITGPYRIPMAVAQLRCVVTNKTPSGAYRGFGTPEMVFAVERLVEAVAQETGQDPVDLRRRMLIRPEDLPYTTPGGRVIDSGSHLAAFERAVAWAVEARARFADAPGDIGVGFASYIEGVAPNYQLTSGLWGQHETVELRVEPDGTVVAASGLGPMGQGSETMLATLVADLVGVPASAVEVRLGDTDLTPYGLGSFGSRSTVVAAGAVSLAADRLTAKLRAIAAGLLECEPDDVVIEAGRAHVRGSVEPALTFAQLAEVAHFRTYQLPPDVEPGLAAVGTYDPRHIDHRPDARGRMNICLAYANSTHAAIVAVDRATGVVRVLDYLAVHDSGPILNPTIVEGQVHGGVAQGIGGALLEELLHSPDGQPLVTSFMDYLLPAATDVPALTIDHLETPSPVTPFGLKGAGEAGTTGCAAAIANAVCDALRDLSIDIVRTPISPSVLRSLVRAAETRDPSPIP